MQSIQEYIERNNKHSLARNGMGGTTTAAATAKTRTIGENQDDEEVETRCDMETDTVIHVVPGPTANTNDKQHQADIVTEGFGTTHPRLQRQAQSKPLATSATSATTAASMPLPTNVLSAALERFQQHVPFNTKAQRDWDAIQSALYTLQEQLKPPKTLQAKAKLFLWDDIPASLRQPFGRTTHVYLHKATYEANDPTEDRSTVVIGTDFVFAGIWDGHGGPACSEFTSRTVFDHFAGAYRDLHDSAASTPQQQQHRVPNALIQAFQKTNRDYYQHARTQNERQAYFAGTCTVACFLDLSSSLSSTGNNPTTKHNTDDAVSLYCANLGDSRAVLGTLQADGTWHTKPLSVDHTAENLLERQRIQALHPHDPYVVMDISRPPPKPQNGNQHPHPKGNPTQPSSDDNDDLHLSLSQHTVAMEDPPDWRVKKMAAFTRSIGDLQFKEKNTAALFNSYMAPHNRILPRPGILPSKHAAVPTPPYISTEAEVQHVKLPGAAGTSTSTSTTSSTTKTTTTTTRLSANSVTAQPSFILLACDGVWDEMTSEEAVDCVGDLLSQYHPPRNSSNGNNVQGQSQQVNIAELFIDKVLEQVVERLRETDEDEKDLTLAQLKQRPKGKETDVSRSILHDDITVVIIQLGSNKAFYRGRRGRSGRGLGSRNASVTSLKSLQKALLRQNLHKSSFSSTSADPMRALQERLKQSDPARLLVDAQIVDMMDFFSGMNVRHLRILFNALDVDGNGTLDRDEIGRLINQVMLTDVSNDVVNIAFDEMDADSSGAVDFLEFVAFFGHHHGPNTNNSNNKDKTSSRSNGLDGTYH